MRRPISSLHPALYTLRVWQKTRARTLRDFAARADFAREIEGEALPFVLKRHQSLLRRKLGNSNPILQENKVTNLEIARQTFDGILIRPGQTFSFWKCVGDANAQKGYLEGLKLSQGEVKTGVGGGLCQLGNLLLWMAWHTPLKVVERHHHSFDPFPDSGRTVPFGSGASLFYPYLDLRFHNPTSSTFQLKVWLEAQHLKGLIACDSEPDESFHLVEKNHGFVRQDDANYRQNEIWRRAIDRRSGNLKREELLVSNFALVKYELPDIIQNSPANSAAPEKL
ncbi:VanW family protein [Abditibacterium utsteinense]|nr:VanW family protein [Abditibacterium utsteinense]